MQTLSRMTGKDFSGPTPEIRAPVVVSLGEQRNDEPLVPRQIIDPSSTTAEHAEELVGGHC